jgi:hypothetical protein
LLAVKFNVDPAQIGELLEAVGAAGIGFTVTTVVAFVLVQPATVTFTEYVPLAATVAPAMEGFCVAEEKLFGPLQEYVAPAILLAVKFSVEPAQIGELLEAVGGAGVGLTVTTVVPALPVHPATVAVTEYVPLAATVAFAMEGFCVAEEKLFGPLHVYVAPAMLLAVRFKVEPAQIGELLEAVGATGAGLTVTTVVPALPVQPPTVAVTEYVPLAAVVAPGIVGFCVAEEKLFGPDHV